jgi:hypothetical protein
MLYLQYRVVIRTGFAWPIRGPVCFLFILYNTLYNVSNDTHYNIPYDVLLGTLYDVYKDVSFRMLYNTF